MRSFSSGRLWAVVLAAGLCAGCTTRSKVDSVIEGFFSEVNKSNFETAKAQYLSNVLINTLNAPGGAHNTIQESFQQVVGQIKSVNVEGTEVKGETATAAAYLIMRWGTRWHCKIELVKQGGREWKITEWDDLKMSGAEHLANAMQYCESRNQNEAVKELQAALLESPKDGMMLNAWGICFMQLGNFTAAEEKFKQAAHMYPDMISDPYLGLAAAYEEQGKLADSEAAMEKAVKIGKMAMRSEADTFKDLAQLRAYGKNTSKLDQGIELAQKALALSPMTRRFSTL